MGIKVSFLKLLAGPPGDRLSYTFYSGQIEKQKQMPTVHRTGPGPTLVCSQPKSSETLPEDCAQDLHRHKGLKHVCFLAFLFSSPERNADASFSHTQLTSAPLVSLHGELSLRNLSCVLSVEGFNTQGLGGGGRF